VISEPLPDTHFYHGSPIVSVRDWRAGLEMARQIIADPKLLERLHLETTKWWHRICSEAATATYVKNQLHQLEQVHFPDDSWRGSVRFAPINLWLAPVVPESKIS